MKCCIRNYYSIALIDKNTSKYVTIDVHRLVAITFVTGRSKDKNIVNHIDQNKLNNHYKNLEWVSVKDNVRYSMGKSVNQVDLITNEIIKTFDTISDANKFMNKTAGNNSKCCTGKQKSAYGYKWKFTE